MAEEGSEAAKASTGRPDSLDAGSKVAVAADGTMWNPPSGPGPTPAPVAVPSTGPESPNAISIPDGSGPGPADS